ncbi:MGMT family protein [Aquifex sp.]
MKRTVILTTVTKLTPSLSLFLNFFTNRLISTKVLKENVDTLLPEFESYFYGIGDVDIPFDILKFSQKHERCISIYKFLKYFVTFGKYTTYGELAKRFNTSARFVGYCMKLNPFPVVIPCHRVLAKNGIGGYSAGVEIKQELLRHEGIL